MVQDQADTNDGIDRRSVVKGAGALAASGALGALAGCSGQDGSESQPGEGSGDDTTTESGQDDSGSDSSSQESVTVTFWSGDAAESSKTRSWFKESMKNFESKNENIKVDLQPISYGDMGTKLTSAVQAGNAPDVAQGGTTGLQFYFSDDLVDHGKYIEETSGLPDNWTEANKAAAKYRGKYWAGGSPRHTYTMLGLNANMFREAGVSGPDEIKTWTGFRRALDKVQETFPDSWAFEVTGTPGDLECYWGDARTAFTGGEDPWIDGSGDSASVKIGQNDRTDGMIKNEMDLASTYSSDKSSQRGDENMPSLLLTKRAASFTYAVGNAPRYTAVKSDVEFGWEGDIWQGPIPKLDANYGSEFGIDELAGKEGEHGGHAWGLEQQKQVYAGSDNPDAAWSLLNYTNTSPDHLVKLYGEIYPAGATYKPLNDEIKSTYGDKLPQIFESMIDAAQEYGPQYQPTGASWDIKDTSQVRWTDINETLSQGIAGKYSPDETVSKMRSRVQKTLSG